MNGVTVMDAVMMVVMVVGRRSVVILFVNVRGWRAYWMGVVLIRTSRSCNMMVVMMVILV